ncbi:MAG: hypothetical protein GX786_02915 [Clostridiales bacterium]|nr:hypothetical protein [Clostridiales bacterium]
MQQIILALGDKKKNQMLEKVFTHLGYNSSSSPNVKKVLHAMKNKSGGLVIASNYIPFFQAVLSGVNHNQPYWTLMVLGKEENHPLDCQEECYYLPLPCKGKDVVAHAEKLLHQQKQVVFGGGFELKMPEKMVYWEGRPLDVTAQEFSLLQVFLKNPEKVLSRELLYHSAWEGKEEIGKSRTVDVHVQRLRKKLGHSACIETIYNQGYCFSFASKLQKAV